MVSILVFTVKFFQFFIKVENVYNETLEGISMPVPRAHIYSIRIFPKLNFLPLEGDTFLSQA